MIQWDAWALEGVNQKRAGPYEILIKIKPFFPWTMVRFHFGVKLYRPELLIFTNYGGNLIYFKQHHLIYFIYHIKHKNDGKSLYELWKTGKEGFCILVVLRFLDSVNQFNLKNNPAINSDLPTSQHEVGMGGRIISRNFQTRSTLSRKGMFFPIITLIL